MSADRPKKRINKDRLTSGVVNGLDFAQMDPKREVKPSARQNRVPKEIQVQRAVQNSFLKTLMQPDLPQHQSRNRRLENQNQRLQNFSTDVAGSQTYSQIRSLQKLEAGLQPTAKASNTFRNASSMNILNPRDEG